MYPISDVQFADAHGSSIAFMSYGEGPVTICAVPPMAQNIELVWDVPHVRRMFDRFAAFSRQIMFDKRGTGMSDRSLDIPLLDERVDELKAVMDAAGVERAFLHGLSEGGPMSIMFAATYPERVEGLILEATGASLVSDEQRSELESPDALEAVHARWGAFAAAWGTPNSLTLSIFAPSLLNDADVVSWWPRYERQSASRDALTSLFEMNGRMDARDVLSRVECPVLILHRRDDPVIPFERAQETHQLLEEAGADVTLIAHDGHDHFTFAQDIEPIAAAIERFTTGTVQDHPPLPVHRVEITTMGQFRVLVDGDPVPTSAWGSKRARTLLKRLIVARGWPVTRDALIELLWPGEDSTRLGARLSVQLSAVRRVLHGAVIADRETVRIDLEHVEVDVERWFSLSDDDEIVDRYAEFLPEDVYEDWATSLHDEALRRFLETARRIVAAHMSAGAHSSAEAVLRSILEVDAFDDAAHRELVRALHAQDRIGDARKAHDAYAAAMGELGVAVFNHDEIAD